MRELGDQTETTPQAPASGRRWIRRVVIVVGCGGVFAAGVGVLAHYLGPESNKLIILSSFVPLLVAAGILGTGLLLAARAWRAALAGALVVAIGLFTQSPLFIASSQDFAGYTAGDDIRLLQANIRLGEADAEALVDQVRERAIDVLTVEELTDDAIERLRIAGIDDLLPHQYLVPRESGGGGTGILSRFPLRDTAPLGRFSMENLEATIDVGNDRSVTVVAVHPLPPYPSPAWMWAAEMEKLTGLVHARASDGDPIIVSGDFNSTYSHSRYRALLTDGFEDAAEVTGAGLVATYPAGGVVPAIIGIDHIVVRDLAVTEFERVEISGSDHHGLFAVVTPQFRQDSR